MNLDWNTFALATILNLLVFALYVRVNTRTKIKATKSMPFVTHLTKGLDQFKGEIKVDYLPDSVVKLSFPVKVLDGDLFFYVGLEDGNQVVLTDMGYIVSRMSMDRTMNRNMLKRIHRVFGVKYDSNGKTFSIKCDQEQIGDCIWKMYSALLVIEYGRY